jgi:ParB family chromosome partitioning protein
MPSEVQLALKDGIITMGHAKAIGGLDLDLQLKALKRCVKKSLSVRQAEELARKMAETSTTTKETEDEEYPESYSRLVMELERIISDNISIKRTKSGGGKITIGFDNDSDIDRFIERFSKK